MIRKLSQAEIRLREAMRPYASCEQCVLSATRRKVVLGEGDVPADVLIVGLCPEKADDMIGAPFRGPNGAVVNRLVREACKLSGRTPRIYYTNVIACRPTTTTGHTRDPLPDEILFCRPRLSSVVSVVSPQYVFFLGTVAAREARAVCPDGLQLPEPGYLLRMGGAGQAIWRACLRTMVDVFREV